MKCLKILSILEVLSKFEVLDKVDSTTITSTETSQAFSGSSCKSSVS